MEKWKIIRDYPNYLISDNGRVISTMFMLAKTHKAKTIDQWMLKPDKDKDGYYRYRLYKTKEESRKFFAHRLVATHFLNVQINSNLVVNHKDGNKNNNHYLNLELITTKENNRHAYSTGLMANRFSKKRSKSLTDSEKNEIKSLRGKMKPHDIADKFNVSYQTVYNVWGGCSSRIDVIY